MFCLKNILDKVGLFDESLPVCEDYDIQKYVLQKKAFAQDKLTYKYGGHKDQEGCDRMGFI